MKDDLKGLFRSILKEELEPVHREIAQMRTDLQNIGHRLKNIESRIDDVDKSLQNVGDQLWGMDKRFGNLEEAILQPIK